MIRDTLEPLVCERFKTDARYREGHLRILNALPDRKVLGLHSQEMKDVAKGLATGRTVADDGVLNGMNLIATFEAMDPAQLCYEEMAVWGFMINFLKCPVERKLEMLDKYVPVLDNWGVCDSYVSHAKWMKKVSPDVLLAWIEKWFHSHREFEVRFAVVVSMSYLLDSKLDDVFAYLDNIDFESIVSDYCFIKAGLAEITAEPTMKHPSEIQAGCVIGPEPYYVRMAVAWLLATALAKYPEKTRAYVNTSRLPQDVLKLYARKARESFRTRFVNPF